MIPVVFEDERLLAVDKPCGRVVVPGRGEVGEALSAELSRQAGPKLYVVHRIDREASGLVVFAKDAAAHRQLCGLFEGRKIGKVYSALVQGRVTKDGEVDKPLQIFGSGRTAVAEGGKPSVTRYRVRERFPSATLLDVSPLTGRRHQIRAHLFSIGHPLLGDPLYGRERPVGGAPRLMLHALALELPEPWPSLRAEAGPDFQAVLASLRALGPKSLSL